MTEALTAVLPSAPELTEIVEQVWASFLEGEFVPVLEPELDKGYDGRLIAWVSISGDWSGHLMVVCSDAAARTIATDMFQLEGVEVSTAEVADALGEIANMVGGSVKGMVGAEAALSLPQVVLDAAALVSPEAQRLVTVQANWKNELLEFSLWERQPGHIGGIK
jgi:chemotaxis protein CheX